MKFILNLSRKGQQSLEYLLTHSWAIMVVLLIGGLLWRMGVFSPSKGEKTIRGFSGLEVVDFGIYGNPSNHHCTVLLTMVNNRANPVRVTGMSTSINSQETIPGARGCYLPIDNCLDGNIPSASSPSTTDCVISPGSTFHLVTPEGTNALCWKGTSTTAEVIVVFKDMETGIEHKSKGSVMMEVEDPPDWSTILGIC